MRCAALLLPLLLAACAKKDAPEVDTMATRSAATDTTPPAAMAAQDKLTAANLRGTWNGKTMALDKDSVLREWTTVSLTDTTATLTMKGTKQAIPVRVTFDADSMIATSAAYASSAKPNAPKITFRSIGRMHDGKMHGTVTNMLASKPDSVVSRARWESTKAK